MSLEKDVTIIIEGTIFKPQSKEDIARAKKERLDRFIAAKAEYIKNPKRCPFCGSFDISDEFIGPDLGPRTIQQSVVCADCDGEWNEIYTMTDIRPVT